MLSRTRLALCVALCLGLLCRPSAVAAYGKASDLTYNTGSGQLSGYSATWTDWWDVGSGLDCLYYVYDEELGYVCGVYLQWVNWVSVIGRLYSPSGTLTAQAYTKGYSYAEVDLVPFVPQQAGVWTEAGAHYVETDNYYYYLDPWGGYSVYYLGGSAYLGGTSDEATAGCGGQGVDLLILEYVNYGVQPTPTCTHFRNFSPSALVSTYFTWGDVNHPEDNTHGWAIVSGYMLIGLDQTESNYASTLQVTSGYRCPHITGGGSYYHMWGRASDIKPSWAPPGALDPAVWQELANAANMASPPPQWIEPYNYDPPTSRTHVHAQWQ